MKKFIFVLALLAFFSAPFFSQTDKTPVKKIGTVRVKIPPAQKIQPPPKVKEAPKTLGITVEKYTVNYEVNTDGTSTELWEMQQRYDSDIAIERLKNFVRVFNGDLQKVEILEAYILKADGKKIAVAPENAQIKLTAQAEAAPSFSSLKQVQINFNELQIGDATYFKIRMTNFKPYFDKQFDLLETFPFIYAWKNIEINLTSPADFPLSIQTIDMEGGKIADENGKARYRWHKENLPALEIEPAMLDFYNGSPRLAVSSFKNFDELGAAYWSEAKKKAVVTEEVQKLADEITKDLKEPQHQAYAIYEWVNKNIRYLSIVLDKGGWIPHSTTEILANRYGDCKDYSTILYALLKAKNIESQPVLIRSDMSDWFPEVATPDYFNHAILYIPSLNLFADATAPNTRLGLITQTIVGKKAVLSGEKTGVIETPKDNPDDNQLLSEVEINFAPDGSLKAISKNTYSGRNEINFRPIFSSSEIQKNSESFIKLLLSYYGVQGSGKILNIGNPFKVGEPFTVDLETQLPDFTTFLKKGSFTMPVALNMINMLELEQFTKSEQRRSNLVLGATRFRESFKINFPEGVKIESVPPAINISNAAGSYRSEFVIEGGSVKLLRELVISKDVVTVKDYPQLRDLITKSVESINGQISYSANPLFAKQKSKTPRVKPVEKISTQSVIDLMMSKAEEKPASAAQVAQFENKLLKTPDDVESRKKVLRFYSSYSAKETPARRAARLKHRLWFVRNRPELDELTIYGYLTPLDSAEDSEYQTVRAEWLKQVESNKTNARIRLNAVEFLRGVEPEKAETLLIDGRFIDPENYEFSILLSEFFYAKTEDIESAEEPAKAKTENLQKAFENGETALLLLKKERSEERDSKRETLLRSLPKIAFELGKLDRAKSLATELILDFGQDAASSNYDEATHFGNTILGRAALKENNAERAKEYLLISIRAPLRRERSYLTDIETSLAKELFEKGEKETVGEFFKLCESLWNFKNNPNLYADEINALKLWQEQIKQGKTPSFDFDNP